MKKKFLRVLTALALISSFALTATAFAKFPEKPINMVIAFTAGGSSDVQARIMQKYWNKYSDQQWVFVYKPGAGGAIGFGEVAMAKPDGYTIGGINMPHAILQTLMQKAQFSVDSFSYICQVVNDPQTITVRKDSKFTSVQEIFDFAKANPGKLDYGYVHAASGHMAMELFKQTAGIFMTGIPYRGGGPMLNAIIGNEIPVMFINQDVALPHIKSGKLRPLAVSSLERNALYPDVPTLNESGYPGFEALSWSGLSVPKGTPAPVVAKLEAALREVMASSAIKQRMDSQGFVVPPQGAKHYTEFVGKELDRWTKVIKTAGLKAQ